MNFACHLFKLMFGYNRYDKLPFLSMFLSNQQAAAIALSVVIATAAGCSWLTGTDPAALPPPAIVPPETGLPFETKEPDVYQADFVTIAAGSESRSRFARKA